MRDCRQVCAYCKRTRFWKDRACALIGEFCSCASWRVKCLHDLMLVIAEAEQARHPLPFLKGKREYQG